MTVDFDKANQIRNSQVGSLLNCMGTERTLSWTKIAMPSRLRNTLIFGQDVVHGYKTTFPIPLTEACIWDLYAMELSARIAATEASASSIQWTFDPMVEIARDLCWGRVMEGDGEDPYPGSQIAAAWVKGFHGDNIGDINSLMACAKHFAAYGATIGGRDYNSVDMSDWMLWEVYLPPFKAAAEAGNAIADVLFGDYNPSAQLPTIDKEKLSFYKHDMKWVTEPGYFELMNGAYSTDIRLESNFELVR